MSKQTNVDLRALHEAKIEELEHILHVEVPQTRQQLQKLKMVLRDKETLTDALANAVFKNHNIVRNANLKKRAVKRREKGDEKGAEKHAVPNDAYERIQSEAQEHKNYLRRLKGKSANKLNPDEIYAIEKYIEKKEEWLRQNEDGKDFINYIFKSQKIIEEYETEEDRVQNYLQEANEEHDTIAIEEARKQQRIEGPTSSTALAIVTSPKNISKAVVTTNKRFTNNTNITSYLAQTDAFSRKLELQSEYLQLIGEEDVTGLKMEQMKTTETLYCNTCHVERLVDLPNACIVCPSCAVSERYTDNSLRTVPFSHPVNAPRSKGTYEKKTYYEKWKKMVTGQLNSEIPEEDWQKIYLECVNRRYNFIDRSMLRKLLRTLGMTRYYELIPMITNELNGVPLIKWSVEEEKTLDTMFDEAVELFDRCPIEIKRRSNFISYSYFFYQACTMAGYLEYRESFPLLSGIDNKKRHDRIWQWMCENKTGEPVWVFYPTV